MEVKRLRLRAKCSNTWTRVSCLISRTAVVETSPRFRERQRSILPKAWDLQVTSIREVRSILIAMAANPKLTAMANKRVFMDTKEEAGAEIDLNTLAASFSLVTSTSLATGQSWIQTTSTSKFLSKAETSLVMVTELINLVATELAYSSKKLMALACSRDKIMALTNSRIKVMALAYSKMKIMALAYSRMPITATTCSNHPSLVKITKGMVTNIRVMAVSTRVMVAKLRVMVIKDMAMVANARAMVANARAMVVNARAMVANVRAMVVNDRAMVVNVRAMVVNARAMVANARAMVANARATEPNKA